jgi:hypothetical protein
MTWQGCESVQVPPQEMALSLYTISVVFKRRLGYENVMTEDEPETLPTRSAWDVKYPTALTHILHTTQSFLDNSPSRRRK